MEKNIKVIVAAHKKYQMPNEKMYIPVQVGAEGKKKIEGYIQDNTGNNISFKNPYFCELTGLYWAWKNLRNVDYIGLCHYRRYFDIIITEENIEKLMSECDVIVPAAIHHSATLYNDKFKTMSGEDIAIFFKVLEEKFPKYYCAAVNYIMNNNKDYAYNMLICSRTCYENIMNFLFFQLSYIISSSRP